MNSPHLHPNSDRRDVSSRASFSGPEVLDHASVGTSGNPVGLQEAGRDLAERSCAAQGIPVKLSRAELDRIAPLFHLRQPAQNEAFA